MKKILNFIILILIVGVIFLILNKMLLEKDKIINSNDFSVVEDTNKDKIVIAKIKKERLIKEKETKSLNERYSEYKRKYLNLDNNKVNKRENKKVIVDTNVIIEKEDIKNNIHIIDEKREKYIAIHKKEYSEQINRSEEYINENEVEAEEIDAPEYIEDEEYSEEEKKDNVKNFMNSGESLDMF